MLTEIANQRLPVARAVRCGTNAIDLKHQGVVHAESPPKLPAQRDQLDVLVGCCHAKGFDTQLMKLALATFLGPFVAKHRPHVPQALRCHSKVVLHHRPHTPRRPLRAQRHTVVIAIREAVHLFFDNIGDFADGAGKQIRRLDNG